MKNRGDAMPVQMRIAIDDEELRKKFNLAYDSVSDLRPVLTLIRESWFKGNRAIFALKGPGKFADLTAKYKKRKQLQLGFVYPILKRRGLASTDSLESALTVPDSKHSIARIIGKFSLYVGVNESNDIFRYLYEGTSKMKARPYIFVGAEQTMPSNYELNNRAKAWNKLIVDYVMQHGRLNG